MSMSSASELESSLISFAGSDSSLALSSKFTTMGILAGNPVGVGGDYSREAIIINISIKGGDYSREAINGGTAIIRENTVYSFYSFYFLPLL